MYSAAVLLAVFACCLPQGDAIKCHSCTSATDPKCGDPMDHSEALVECTPDIVKEGGKLLSSAADAVSGVLGKLGFDQTVGAPDVNSAFVCMKAVRQEGDKKLVVRSCGLKADKFDACADMKEKVGKTVTFCETCEKDGCNGSTTVVPSSLLLLLLAAVAAYFVKN